MVNALVEMVVDSLMLVKFAVTFYVVAAVAMIVVFPMTKVKERHVVIFQKVCAIVAIPAVSTTQLRIKKLIKAMRQ